MGRRGFTLIEILLVAMIFSLGAVLTGMAVYRRTDRITLQSSAQRMLQMSRYARLQAAERHQDCQLHIDADQGRYWLTAKQSGIPVWELEAGDDGEAAVAEEYARHNVLPGKVSFGLVEIDSETAIDNNGRYCISFNRDGSADSALVQLQAGEHTITLLIYPWTSKAELRNGAVEQLASEMVETGGQ